MDCRTSVTLVLGLGLVAGGLGCAEHGNLALTAQKEYPPPGAEVRKEPDLPLRQPKVSTLVALGDFNARAGSAPNQPQPLTEQLRDRARKCYQQALNQEPGNLPAHLGLARLYTAMNDHQHEVAAYRRATQYHPRDAALWHELGLAHARHKEWEAALQALDQAHKLDPENRRYVRDLGFSLGWAGYWDDSLAVFKTTMPEAEAHYNLARLTHHLQQEERSRTHLVAALQRNPQHKPSQELLAQLQGATNPVQQVGHAER